MQLLAFTILIFLFCDLGLSFTQTGLYYSNLIPPKTPLGYIIRDLESTTQTEFSQETMAWENTYQVTGNAYDTDCNSIYLMGGYGFNPLSVQKAFPEV